MSWFAKKTAPEATGPTDVDLIRAKITACDAEIASAEDELRRVSVAAALADDPAGMEVLTKLNTLRAHKDLLSDALRSALDAEKEAAGRLNEREYQARKRSLAQKIEALNRDAQSLTEALAATRDAQRRMVGTAAGIVSLLPASLRDDFERRLGPAHLLALTEIEMSRLCDGGLTAIGARPVVSARDENGQVTPLAQTIDELAANVRAGFERCGPAQPKASQPTRETEEVTA